MDDSQNMVILHPDHLISTTVVSDSTSCPRRAVLQDRIKYSGDVGKAQVFGNIFHEVFQEAIKTNTWDLTSLSRSVNSIMVRHVEDLYIIQMTVSEGVEYIMGRISAMRSWAEAFLRVTPTVSFSLLSSFSALLTLENRKNQWLKIEIALRCA